MKLWKRIILGVIRKPLKSIVLLCVMLVICTMLSGSLILYNATQNTKDKVNSLISPAVSVQTPLSSRLPTAGFLDKDQLTYLLDLEKQLYKTLSEFEEVDYFDYASVVYLGRDPILDDEKYYIVEAMPQTYKMITANHYDPYLVKSGQIKIVDGRYFTKEEIENGSNVVVLPKILYLEFDGEIRFAQVGDKIELKKIIYKSDPFAGEAYEYYLENFKDVDPNYKEGYEKAVEFNKEFEKYIYEIITYEAEVIGLYEKNIRYIQNTVSDDMCIIPQLFANKINEEYLTKKKNLEAQGIIEIFDNENSEYNFFNYYQTKNSKLLDEFTNKIKNELNNLNGILLNYENEINTGLDRYRVKVSMDTYLKVAGPLESMNIVSKMIIMMSLIVGTIVLFITSIMLINDRKKEIGVLLTLGESKQRVTKQVLAEVMLIGLLAISISTFTTGYFSNMITDSILDNRNIEIELTEEEQALLGDVTQDSILDQYKLDLESTDKILIVIAIGTMISITSAISVLFVLKMNPKDILM